jgi:hypothetical protein
MAFGRRYRPSAAFHKPPAPATLPRFDFQAPTAIHLTPDTPIEALASRAIIKD